ncbi:MAG: DUF2484 family protein [Paracoccaceae bacterium]|nr:DUF2484 family protein [Paracoccaceae bacterium]
MSVPVILALVWLVTANVIGMFPSPKRHHWPSAYALMTVGLPLLVWLFISDGWIAAAVFLVAGASILRWPVRFLFRRIGRVVGGGKAPG